MTIRSQPRITFSLLLLLVTIPGCCPVHLPPPPHLAYTGQTDPMYLVIQDINRNSGSIPTLWTQLNFSGTFINPEKHSTDTVYGDGALMYAKPMSLLLTGNKDIAGQVFELGSNEDEFWVKLRTGADAYDYWWGHYTNLGKPCCQPIPLRPDLVLEVLGVGLYKMNFLVQPVPVMRFDNDADAYVFDFSALNVDHWELIKEVWYDRASKLPQKVLLFGNKGRVILRADLSQHKPVKVSGIPPPQWPKIAGHFDLSFPDSGNQISFDLVEPSVQHTGRVTVPNARSFDRQDPDDNAKVIQIDQGCTDPAASAR